MMFKGPLQPTPFYDSIQRQRQSPQDGYITLSTFIYCKCTYLGVHLFNSTNRMPAAGVSQLGLVILQVTEVASCKTDRQSTHCRLTLGMTCTQDKPGHMLTQEYAIVINRCHRRHISSIFSYMDYNCMVLHNHWAPKQPLGAGLKDIHLGLLG